MNTMPGERRRIPGSRAVPHDAPARDRDRDESRLTSRSRRAGPGARARRRRRRRRERRERGGERAGGQTRARRGSVLPTRGRSAAASVSETTAARASAAQRRDRCGAARRQLPDRDRDRRAGAVGVDRPRRPCRPRRARTPPPSRRCRRVHGPRCRSTSRCRWPAPPAASNGPPAITVAVRQREHGENGLRETSTSCRRRMTPSCRFQRLTDWTGPEVAAEQRAHPVQDVVNVHAVARSPAQCACSAVPSHRATLSAGIPPALENVPRRGLPSAATVSAQTTPFVPPPIGAHAVPLQRARFAARRRRPSRGIARDDVTARQHREREHSAGDPGAERVQGRRPPRDVRGGATARDRELTRGDHVAVRQRRHRHHDPSVPAPSGSQLWRPSGRRSLRHRAGTRRPRRSRRSAGARASAPRESVAPSRCRAPSSCRVQTRHRARRRAPAATSKCRPRRRHRRDPPRRSRIPGSAGPKA